MLRVLGLLFLTIIILAAAAAGIWFHQDTQARRFVAAATSSIYKDWSIEALEVRMASDARTPVYEAQRRDLFQMLGGSLGPLESAGPPEGTLRYGRANPGLSPGLYGKYTSQAKFKGGDAELECVVIKEDGAWRIVAINIESEALLNAAQKAKSAPAAGSTWNRGPAEDEAAVLAEAEEILRLLDSEYPATAWDRASKVFQDAMPKARFTARLERMHEKSGHLQGRKLQGIGFMFDRPGASPPGNYAVADYVSTYSQVTLDERLGFYQVEGRWLFSGYQWTERKSK